MNSSRLNKKTQKDDSQRRLEGKDNNYLELSVLRRLEDIDEINGGQGGSSQSFANTIHDAKRLSAEANYLKQPP